VRHCLLQKTQVQKNINYYKGEACASPSKLQVQKNLGRDICLILNHKFKILELSLRGSIIFLIMDDEKKCNVLKLEMKDIDFGGFKMRVIITYFRVFKMKMKYL